MPARPLFWLTVFFMLGISVDRLFGEGLPVQTHYFAFAAFILIAAMAVALWGHNRLFEGFRPPFSVLRLPSSVLRIPSSVTTAKPQARYHRSDENKGGKCKIVRLDRQALTKQAIRRNPQHKENREPEKRACGH